MKESLEHVWRYQRLAAAVTIVVMTILTAVGILQVRSLVLTLEGVD